MWKYDSIYEGMFSKNKPHGCCREIKANGDYYEGNWNKGKYDGKGIYQEYQGPKYMGDFKKGKKSGEGTKTWASGTKSTKFTG